MSNHIDAYEMLQNTGAEHGWDENTMLRMACNFIDDRGSMRNFILYIDQCIADEQDMSGDYGI